MSKKCYISVPMEGRDEIDVIMEVEDAVIQLMRRGYMPIAPTDKAVNPDLSAPLPVLLGNDIRALLECEAFCYIGTDEELKGHPGCQVEIFTASTYGKEIVRL